MVSMNEKNLAALQKHVDKLSDSLLQSTDKELKSIKGIVLQISKLFLVTLSLDGQKFMKTRLDEIPSQVEAWCEHVNSTMERVDNQMKKLQETIQVRNSLFLNFNE